MVLDGRVEQAMQASVLCHRALSRLKDWPGRSLASVNTKLCIQLRKAGRRRQRIEWSAAANRLVRRYARAVSAGRIPTVAEAARACAAELDRLPRASEDSLRPATATVYHAIWELTRGSRHHGSGTEWTESEDRIVRRHARGLIDDRYRNPAAAAKACVAAFRKAKSRRQPERWAPISRSVGALRARLVKLAQAEGYRPWRRRYRQWEQETIDRHVQAILDDRYDTVLAAAADCCRALGAHRRKLRPAGRPPVRSRTSIRDQLSRRARKHGWSWHDQRWRPDEQRILDRHAKRLTASDSASILSAARQCQAELRRLHERLLRRDPGLCQALRERTLSTLRTYLARRSREAGREPEYRWTEPEKRIVLRYARAVLAERFPDAQEAGDACLEVLTRRRLQRKSRSPGPVRTRIAVREHVRRLAHTLGERWPKTRWTPKELTALRRTVDWYERNRGIRRLRPSVSAVEGLQLELEQMQSRRSLSACRARFWKEWQRQHGLG